MISLNDYDGDIGINEALYKQDEANIEVGERNLSRSQLAHLIYEMKFENISCDTQLPTKEKDTIRFLYRLSVDNTHGGANKVGIFQVKLKSEANFIDQIAFFTPENGGFENDLKSNQTTSPECKNLLGFLN